MAEAFISLKLDASQLEKFGRALDQEINRSGTGRRPMHEALVAAALRYMAFIRRRFATQSRGGGEWPNLSPSTLARRRSGAGVQGRAAVRRSNQALSARGVSSVGRAAILRDTGTLANSTTNYATEQLTDGVRVGSEVQYGKYHQEGGKNPGRPPRRAIFVDPDPTTMDAIRGQLERGYQNSINGLGGTP